MPVHNEDKGQIQSQSHMNSHGQPIGVPLLGWKSCPLPPRTPMEGRRVRLEPLSVGAHCEDLFAAFENDTEGRMWTYLSIGPFQGDRAGLQKWLVQCETSADPLFFAIVSIQSNCALGYVAFMRMQPAVGVIEVGHVTLSPALQRTVMSTEAMFLMMARCFDELGYRRYEWKCDHLNAASRRAAERLGFRFEGVFRQATVYKGRNRDTAWYSILDSEWPHLKKKFAQWLEPANFDDEGKQKHSLHDIAIGLQGSQEEDAELCVDDIPKAKCRRL